MSVDKLPVLLIGFRRSLEIKKVIASLSSYQPSHLYLAMDGPRSLDEASLTEKARSEAVRSITWPCSLQTFFSDTNLGCGSFVVDAITWFFANEDYGIILEDDIVIHLNYFAFVEAYKSSLEFSCICACTFENALDPRTTNGKKLPFSSRIPSIWGWSTRRQVWSEFLHFQRSRNPIVNFKVLITKIGFWQSLLFAMCLDYKDRSLMDTWDYDFAFFLLTTNKLSLFPACQMSSNIGNSILASNCSINMTLTESLKEQASFDYILPEYVKLNRFYMRHQSMNTLMNTSYKLQSIKHACKIFLAYIFN